MGDEIDISELSEAELERFIQECRVQIAAARAQIEPPSAESRRTYKLIRGTVLAAGGFIGASFDILSLFLVLLGFWDWAESLSDDAREMNKRTALVREARMLDARLRMAETRLRALRAGS